jgi:MFS family permease
MRYQLLVMIWLLQFVNYLDRVSIAVAGPAMVHALSLDAAQFGVLMAAFALGYALMQLPGGYLADRFGTKALLVVAPVLFSIFTGLTGLATSMAALIAARFCFGLAEGSCNAAVYKAVADNFTAKEAAKAHSVWLSALAIGPAVVAPIVVSVLQNDGWQHVFYVFAFPGLVVAALMLVIIPGSRIEGKSNMRSKRSRTGQWRLWAGRKSTWLLFFGYMMFSIGYWGFLGWIPSYLAGQRHIDLKSLGVAASVPYVFGLLGIVVFGMLGSGFMHRKRPILVAFGYVLTGLALYLAYSAASIVSCVVGLSAAAFLLYGCLSPYAGLVAQLAPDGARGVFAGVINTGGQIGGLVAPLVVGYLVKTSGTFSSGFIFMISALAVGALCFGGLQLQMNRKDTVPESRSVNVNA